MSFKISAGEAGNLWLFILSNHSSLCFLKHDLAHVENEQIKETLLVMKRMAERILKQATELYTKAGFPAPIGFQTEDVKTDAPRLFTDKFYLHRNQILTEYGITAYSMAYGKAVTPEVLDFYSWCIQATKELYRSLTEIINARGEAQTVVHLYPSSRAEMTKKQSFLSGWIGKQRPVNAVEIDGLIFSLRGVMLAKAVMMSFSQIAKDSKVKEIFTRIKDIYGKRVNKIETIIARENLPFLPTFEIEVTDATESPFTDQLMMHQTLALAQLAIARYGSAFSTCTRRDLAVMYTRFIAETALLSEDVLNIMIEHEWYEQPPLAVDRDQLSKL